MSGNLIDVIIDGQPVRALVDSGASFSVLSDNYRRTLKKTMFCDTGATVLKVANGKYVHPAGTCVARITINNRTQPFEFVVLTECSHNVILGWDFLQASQAIIDCGRSELQIEEVVPPDTRNTEFSGKLFVVDNVTIPPLTMRRVAVTNTDDWLNCEVLVDSKKFIRLTKEIYIPAAIISITGGQGEIWITNCHEQSQLIPKGMCIGTAEPIQDGELNVINEDPCPAISTDNTLEETNVELPIGPGLTKEQRQRVLGILRQFSGAFTPQQGKSQTKRPTIKHRINTGDHPPISQRSYRVSPAERRIIREEVEKMLRDDIIQPSESPWSSPVVLVKKKDGTWRFCVDYRRLNRITKKDVYPLPRIDNTLDCLKGATYFSTMDMQTGYWQIEVDEADREKTAFITPDGLYEFKVMPFGLCNAPATFERMMDNLLRHLKWTTCLCYLDDIVVFSKTFEEHLSRLSTVLKCVQAAGLRLNPKKCLFVAKEIKILGHLVNGDGVRPDPDKVRAVTEFPTPQHIRDVRSFLGLCSYYRRFIKGFCNKARPLQELLQGDAKFYWDETKERAFRALKEALTSAPVLALYDENAETELHTDASGYGIGAVLVQVQEGAEKVIAYASRVLSKSEINYSTTEKECLAVIWAINKFRPYLFGKPFTVVTDHHSLCWLTSLKDPSGRLARWALRLQEYDVTVVFKNGRKHKDADCLSRNPLVEHNSINEISALTELDDVTAEQREDPTLLKMIEALEKGEPTNGEFQLINGTLYKSNYDPLGPKWLLVVPAHLQPAILKYFHDAPISGHLGFVKTLDRIRRRYYWKGLYRSVKHYVSHCKECQRRKHVPQLPPGHLVPIPPAAAPFHRVGIDLLGRFPKSTTGNRWIIVCTDYLTRYAVTKPVPTAEAPEIAKFLVEDIILKHGAPRVMISDRGKVFQSKLVSEVMSRCNIVHRMTTAYHPQTNGLTERFNKTLADMLSMYVDVEQKDWDTILPVVTFAYNTARQDTTGFTPFFLLHGREAETTMDTLFPFQPDDTQDDYVKQLITRVEEARQLARIRTLDAQEKDRQRYNDKHRPVVYSPGDLVWIFTPVRKVGLSEKLLKRYFGPYRVIRRLSDVTYEVEDYEPSSKRQKRRDIVHVLRMKPYYDPEEQVGDNGLLFKNSKDGNVTGEAMTGTSVVDNRGEGKDSLELSYRGPMTRSRSRTLQLAPQGS